MTKLKHVLPVLFCVICCVSGFQALAADPFATDIVQGDAYANEFANRCLKSIQHALVISHPEVDDHAAVPGSQVFIFPFNDMWEGGQNKAPQVTTVDKSVLQKGAISAVITPTGKVIQIMENGSCLLSENKFNSSYDFIAGQLGKLQMSFANSFSPEERLQVAKYCGSISNQGPFAKIRSELLRLHLIEKDKASAGSSATTTN